jgi:eukaryotic-like serine/threonine-protein kinase
VVEAEARDPHIAKKYQVTRMVARGGMGRVLEARRRRDRRHVAIKVLHPELIHDASCRRLMQQEVQALRLATHPLVVKLLEHGETALGQPFLVFEWLEGKNLKHMIIEDGALAPPRVLHVFASLLDALSLCHRRGIVHGDLKPENVMVVPSRRGHERVRLLDFGIATINTDPDAPVKEVFGTPGYLAPELYTGRAPSPASDVYAAGIVLFELMTGRSPFVGKTRGSLWREQVELPPPRISDWVEGAGAEMDALLMRSLAVAPENRYPTAAAFKTAFRRAIAHLCTARAATRRLAG